MALVKTQIPEGYATIRRSKSRASKKYLTSDTQQFEMIDMSAIKPRVENLYDNHRNNIYDSVEVDEGVINDIETDGDVFLRKNGDEKNCQEDYFSDNKRRTFQTFKPRENGVNHHSSTTTIETNSSSTRDLRQSSEYLPYDLLMTPLKSPQYINQLNAMRNINKSTLNGDAAANKFQQQFPFYARPESPSKYSRMLHNNRSTSPSADSIDNCSSNSSSTYSPAYRNGNEQLAASLTSEDNLMLIENAYRRAPPTKASNLNYRKSFSHVHNRTHYNMYGENNNGSNYINRKHKESLMANSQECISSSNGSNFEKPSISTLTMTTKPLGVPSVSTSNLYTRRRFATLAHPKEKLRASAANTKSTSSLNESHVYWDPVLDSKIGSQTTLRTKPAIPWWEIACKKEYRQSCPPMQVNKIFLIIFLKKIHNQF
jgi:hypothetical protein